MDVIALSISMFFASCILALIVYQIIDGFDAARHIKKIVDDEIYRIEKEKWEYFVQCVAKCPEAQAYIRENC